MSSYASHRYPTRFQSKKQQSQQSEYAKNLEHMNRLYTRTQTTHNMDRTYAMTDFYVFLQEFQPWKENAQLRAALKQKITHYLEVELPDELEDALKWRSTQKKEDALYALEAAMLGLQRLM
jgi:hypothetical protein